MVVYHLDFTHLGKTSLSQLDHEVGQRVVNKLKWLLENIENISPVPLYGTLTGLFKLRVGDWRVIYEINWKDQVIK